MPTGKSVFSIFWGVIHSTNFKIIKKREDTPSEAKNFLTNETGVELNDLEKFFESIDPEYYVTVSSSNITDKPKRVFHQLQPNTGIWE